MGIENERTSALSVESIPKSISEVHMDQSTEIGNNETTEPLERQNSQRAVEKNGEFIN